LEGCNADFRRSVTGRSETLFISKNEKRIIKRMRGKRKKYKFTNIYF
jgi:hypothetical protein